MPRYFGHISLITGTMLILSMASFAAPSPTKTQADSAQSARLLKSVAADARQIRSAAAKVQQLSTNSSADWQQYDRQWNELQPVVESMRGKIARLEAMSASLSATEKQALEQSKAECQKIAWHSRDLGRLIDQVPPDLTAAGFKIDSRDLVTEAGDVAKVAKAAN